MGRAEVEDGDASCRVALQKEVDNVVTEKAATARYDDVSQRFYWGIRSRHREVQPRNLKVVSVWSLGRVGRQNPSSGAWTLELIYHRTGASDKCIYPQDFRKITEYLIH